MKSFVLFVSLFVVTMGSAHANCPQEAKIKTVLNFLEKEENLTGCKYLDPSQEIKDEYSEPVNVICDDDVQLSYDVESDHVQGILGQCSGGSIWFMLNVKSFGKFLPNGLCEMNDAHRSAACAD